MHYILEEFAYDYLANNIDLLSFENKREFRIKFHEGLYANNVVFTIGEEDIAFCKEDLDKAVGFVYKKLKEQEKKPVLFCDSEKTKLPQTIVVTEKLNDKPIVFNPMSMGHRLPLKSIYSEKSFQIIQEVLEKNPDYRYVNHIFSNLLKEDGESYDDAIKILLQLK